MTSIALNPTDTLHLVATDRPSLERAHAQMIEWAKARRDKVDVDTDVESTALDLAVQNGWATAAFTRRLNLLARQRTFYAKILAALEAGYAIVPNFPMTIFAIRTTATTARAEQSRSRWARFAQPAQLLPQGDGAYRDPGPAIYQHTEQEQNSKGEATTVTLYTPAELGDVEFPIALARPELMTRVGEAMAVKLFDEIGVAEDAPSRGRGDPILIGRLLNPRRNAPSLTFFLGWYFDPSRL